MPMGQEQLCLYSLINHGTTFTFGGWLINDYGASSSCNDGMRKHAAANDCWCTLLPLYEWSYVILLLKWWVTLPLPENLFRNHFCSLPGSYAYDDLWYVNTAYATFFRNNISQTAVRKMHSCIYQLTIFKNLSYHRQSIVMQCYLNSVESATMQFNIKHNLHQSRKRFPKFIIRNLFHTTCSTPVTQQQYTTDKVDN